MNTKSFDRQAERASVSLGIIGAGRAGGALCRALRLSSGAADWHVRLFRREEVDLARVAHEYNAVVLAVPDSVIAELSASVAPCDESLIIHLSGAKTLEVLAPHHRRGSLHPLVSLRDAESGAVMLRGAWMAVAGDPFVEEIARCLEGRVIRVGDSDRATYHAAAAIAANHLVGLLGQVERVAAGIGVPLAAFLDLAAGTLDGVRAVGPRTALTGPVSRGDWDTVRAHIIALPVEERGFYIAGVQAAAILAGRAVPADVSPTPI